MCLKINNVIQERFFKRVGKKTRIKLWKLVELKRVTVVSFYRASTFNSGLNVSSRFDTPLTSKEVISGEVHFGSHVFLTRQDARKKRASHPYRQSIVVPVECEMSDFVVAGDSVGVPCAVFTKIWVNAADYNRSLKVKTV